MLDLFYLMIKIAIRKKKFPSKLFPINCCSTSEAKKNTLGFLLCVLLSPSLSLTPSQIISGELRYKVAIQHWAAPAGHFFLVFVQTFLQFTALPSGDRHKTDGLILLPATKARTQSTGFPNVHVTIWNTTWFGCKWCFRKPLKLSPHLIWRYITRGRGKTAIPQSSGGNELAFWLFILFKHWCW